MREPVIPCQKCKGKGTRSLSPPLLRVFKAIERLGQPTCPEIFQEVNIDYQDSTVANHYVNRLLKWKLIKKVKVNGERIPRYAVV